MGLTGLLESVVYQPESILQLRIPGLFALSARLLRFLSGVFLPCSCFALEPPTEFKPYDFTKIGMHPGDKRSILLLITGSEAGHDALTKFHAVALIETRSLGPSEQEGFSFSFRGRSVTRHALVEESQASALCRELQDIQNYGPSNYEFATKEVNEQIWSNPIEMEFTDGTRFLRMRFTVDFSHCVFRPCTGELPHHFALAPKVSKRIKTLVDGFSKDPANKNRK